MNLMEYIKQNPLLAILIVMNIYLLYKYRCKTYEKMTDTTSVKEMVNKVYQADIQSIRNLALVSKKLQEGGLTIPGNLTIEGAFNYLPKGSIIAFNGTEAPKGWALCDGKNGTPDLRGRFIRMFNNNTGGFNSWGGKIVKNIKVNYSKDIAGNSRRDHRSWLLKHKFGDQAGTDHQSLDFKEMPAHSHRIDVSREYRCNRSWSGECHAGNIRGSANTSHNTHNSGRSWGHNNQPPYYVLSYIMKL